MADLQGEIDDYYDKYDLEKINQQYNKNLGPTLKTLTRYSRPGENQITQQMLNSALSSEAAGRTASQEAVTRANQGAFGTNPTALNASLATQQNLASQRPVVEATVKAAQPQVAANIGGAITNTMMAKPALMQAHLSPYFANESAIATQEQIDIAGAAATPAEGPGFGEQLLGSVIGAATPALISALL